MSMQSRSKNEEAEIVIPMCIDRILSREDEEKAQKLAAAANPHNQVARILVDSDTGASISIGFEYRKCWAPGSELHIRFLDGPDTVREKVKQVAMEWTKHANVKFIFDDSPDAKIRISFKPGGSWSCIGLDALLEAPDAPTMNLGWLKPESPDEEYSRVVLHEFGHALGAIHEHQSPASPIPWDRAKVIAYYSSHPNYWDEETIQFNVLDRYSEDRVNSSEFDPNSIMLYPIRHELTKNGFEIPWRNSELSERDKEWVGRMYRLTPGATPAVSNTPSK